MKYGVLIWSGLWRRKTRTVLTLLCLVVAFSLYGFLRTIVYSLEYGVEVAGADRLVVAPRYSLVDPMPIAHLNRIAGIEGVSLVASSNWFGGTYQDPANFFPKFPVNPEAYFAMFPEWHIDADEFDAFLKTQTGAVAPASLAEKYGWSIGDVIPIEGDIFARPDGTRNFEFELVGTYRLEGQGIEPNAFLFRQAYFDENVSYGRDTVGWFHVRVADPERAGEVSHAIDSLFENSPNETRTNTEAQFAIEGIKSFGNITGLLTGVLAAVFFTILLLTGNTMAQGVRERIPELAVLKTLGFTNMAVLTLIISESMLMTLLGAAGGLGLVSALAPGIEESISNFLPVFKMSSQVIVSGFVLAVLIGLGVGLAPALSAMRLRIVDALRAS